MQAGMAASKSNDVTIYDGSSDFSGGVDSLAVTTIQSERTPNGLKRTQLAWLVNATVRDGGITQRWGWQPRGTISPGSSLFQGSSIYEPDAANPYIMALIGGNTYKIDPDFIAPPVNLTALFPGTAMPPTQPQAFFAQGELSLLIQAGDNKTLPLIWDGTTLRRSIGINNKAVVPGTPGVNEIPAATAMVYYQGRLWYSQQRNFSGGDIVGGPSGTVAYNFRDAILNVTENPLVVGGDGFTVPTNAGNIRALNFLATQDTTLGQGNLLIFTPKTIYSLFVPITRALWIAATSMNGPLMTVIQITNGAVSDRSIVPVNGDLFYQSLEPAIRSTIAATRYFQQWSNPPTSNEEDRILAFVNRALMAFGSGVTFDNRLLQATMPIQKPQGVINQVILPLDFTPISTLQKQLPPCWEGHYEGLDFLQLLQMNFGGLQRVFGIVLSRVDQSFQLYELIVGEQFEDGDKRVTWQIEFPAYTAGDETMIKKLTGAELWIDSVYGTVEFTMEYRPDSDACWKLWKKWIICSPRNSAEDAANPVAYPLTQYGEAYRTTQTLPVPPDENCESSTGRPAYIGYQFQPRLTVKGWCRIRSITLFMEKLERELYKGLVCDPTEQFATIVPLPPPTPPSFQNTAQTATVTCPDGTTFSSTVPAGTFTSSTQAGANASASAQAQVQANALQLCLSAVGGAIGWNQSVNFNFTATGANAATNTWSVVSGSVPTGMSFNGGVIAFSMPATLTGTPTVAGSYTFKVKCAASNGNTVQKNYTLCVAQITASPAGSDTSDLPKFTIGTPYTCNLAITSCAGTATFAVTSGILPDGLSLSSGGAITGTPANDAVSETFTVTATTPNGTFSQSYICAPVPTGLNFNDLTWVTTIQVDSNITAANNSFDGELIRQASANSLLQFTGTMNYTGPSVLCNLQINITNGTTDNFNLKYGIQIGALGNSVLEIDDSTPLPNGISNFPFTIPAMGGQPITVTTTGSSSAGEWIMRSGAANPTFEMTGVLTPAY